LKEYLKRDLRNKLGLGPGIVRVPFKVFKTILHIRIEAITRKLEYDEV